MPQINLGYSQLGNQQLTPQRGVPNVSGLDREADALSRLAQVGAQTYNEIQENRRNVELAQASVQLAKEIESKEFDFKFTDREYTTQDARYQEFVQDRFKHYESKFQDPQTFVQFKRQTDKFIFDKGLSIKSSAMKNNVAEQQSILNSTLSDISELAIRGDEAQYQDSIERANALIDHSFEIGVIDTQEREATRRNLYNGLARGKVRQDITLDPNKALENIRSSQYKGLSPEEQSQFEAMAISKIEQMRNKSSVQANKQATELVSDTILALNNGYIVQDEELIAAQASSKLIGKEEDLGIAIASSKFVTLPKYARDQLPETFTGVDNAELRVALEKANETIEKELDKDAYTFAVRQRIVEEVPLDLADPQTINARLDQVEYLEKHYGRPVSPLSELEASQLVRALPRMTSEEKVILAQAFGTSTAIWSQLDKKNAGLFAMAGAIQDPEVQQNIFKGQDRLAENLITPPNQIDYLPVFDDYVDDIYTGKDRRNMIDAALAYYAGTTQKDVFNPDEFQQAIEAVSGGIGTINGFKIELPRGVPDDEFEDAIEVFSAQTVREFGGVWGMDDARAADMIRDARIVNYATNQYMAIIDDAVLMNPTNNKPFLFSYDPEKAQRDQGLIRSSRRRRARR